MYCFQFVLENEASQANFHFKQKNIYPAAIVALGLLLVIMTSCASLGHIHKTETTNERKYSDLIGLSNGYKRA